jgi:ABC-type sugar transport system substrate-binding protein
MTRRSLWSLLLAAAVIIVLAVIYWRPSESGKTIAYIVPTLGNPFFVDMTEAAKKTVEGFAGYKIIVQAPAEFTNVEQQIAMIENAATLKVSALCLVASDSKGVVPALKKIQDAGIPILLVDNTVDPAAAKSAGLKVATQIGSDNFLGGRLAAEFIGKTLNGHGQVAMLEGVVGSDVANARKQGFVDGLKAFPNIRLVASQTANYSRDQAVDVFRAILQANPSLDGVFAANDEMALGAIKALSDTQSPKKIVIVGFDATADGLKAIENGTLAATIQQQPKEMGRTAIDLAVKITSGQPIADKNTIPVSLVKK